MIANIFVVRNLGRVRDSLSEFQTEYGLVTFAMTNHFLGIRESGFTQGIRVNS
jgi:hypothetical protein